MSNQIYRGYEFVKMTNDLDNDIACRIYDDVYHHGLAYAKGIFNHYTEDISGFEGYIAYQSGIPVGMVWGTMLTDDKVLYHEALSDIVREHTDQPVFLLNELAVLEEHRMNGVGSSLVKLLTKDKPFVILTIEDDSGNEGFYEKLGYRMIAPDVTFYDCAISYKAFAKGF